MRKTPYYMEVYDYILRQIHTGVLQAGDKLGSIDTLSKQFLVSTNTIRMAINKLSENGFVATGRGKSITVISSSGNIEAMIMEVCNQAAVISENFDLLCLLLPSIIGSGVQHFNVEEIEKFLKFTEVMKTKVNHIEEIHSLRNQLVFNLIRKNNNSLICAVIYRAEKIVMFSSTVFGMIENKYEELCDRRSHYCNQMHKAVETIAKNQLDEMKRIIVEEYSIYKQIIMSLIQQMAKTYSFPTQSLKSYQFDINYLYDTIVSDIIDTFYQGKFCIGDYLPSVRQMCEQYQVSNPTVKKAYAILGELGAAKTINGKGTQLILFAELSITDISVKTISYLSEFLEAIQFITITIEEVALYAGKKLTIDNANEIEKKLRDSWRIHNEPKHVTHSLSLLLFEIVRKADCVEMDLLYQEIKKRMIWSIYLDRFFENPEKEWKSRNLFCLDILEELKMGNVEKFAQKLKLAFEYCWKRYHLIFNKCIFIKTAEKLSD